MSEGPGTGVDRMFSRAFWDERYGSADTIWSGRPNAQLVAYADGLEPGRALDIGCGEGADAVWLAERGWRVVGLDVSAVALTRAAQHAQTRGPAVASKLAWVCADVRTWTPDEDAFDLVSAQFLHLPRPLLRDLTARLVPAVTGGGHLMLVGHDPVDNQAMHRPHPAEMFATADQLAALLGPDDWTVVSADGARRTVSLPDGTELEITDAVCLARRRS